MTAALSVPIVEARELSKRFVKEADLAERLIARLGSGSGPQIVQAVDNVSFAVARGEVVGLVGESGCGKSTLGRMIAGLLNPSQGRVLFKGGDRAKLSGAEAKAARLAVQMIFQDPYRSLNPRRTIGDALKKYGLIRPRRRRVHPPMFPLPITRWSAFALLVLFVAIVPLALHEYYLSIFNLIFIAIVGALGLNIRLIPGYPDSGGLFLAVDRREAAELDQTGFVRMQGQTKLG